MNYVTGLCVSIHMVNITFFYQLYIIINALKGPLDYCTHAYLFVECK